MSNFTFLKKTQILTNTQIVVSSGSATSSFIVDRKTTTAWATVNGSGTTATITWTPASTDTVSDILLIGNNWSNFHVYKNSGTAGNTLATYTNNTDTSLWINFATQTTIDNIMFAIDTTYPANNDKQLYELYIGQKRYTMTRNPAPKDYKPEINKIGRDQEMVDGGMVSYFFDNKFKAEIKFEYVSTTERNSLKSIYDDHEEFVFIPYLTTTAWDGENYEVNWLGGFDFNKMSGVLKSDGFDGKLKLGETPK